MDTIAIPAGMQQTGPSESRQKGVESFSVVRGYPNLQYLFRVWATLIIALTLGQVAATLLVHRGFALTLITDFIAFTLMLSALLVFAANARVSGGQIRLFWTLLATCWGVTVVGQIMWMYFDLVLRKEVPNPFMGDILLFMSSIPVLAALLLQPHLVESRKSQRIVDFLLLLLWWLYLYVFFVIPWQYVVLDEASYGLNYNHLNGWLDIVLLFTLGFLWSQSFGRWKHFYASFFLAQLLLTASGYLANVAIDKHLYYPGSWYDIPYSASLAAATAVGLVGLSLVKAEPSVKKKRPQLHVTRLGMLAVLSLPVIGAWAILNRNTPLEVNHFRELVTLGTMLAMAFLVFAKQGQLSTELAKANRVLQEASLTDPLTGVRNRRFFDVTISGDASQVLRSYETAQKAPANDLIFYMIDLDNFKDVNDRYGHHVGDRVLQEVTRRINSVIRSSDVLVRWGGDEFLIVSRFANRAEGTAFASRILRAVGDPRISAAAAGVEVCQTCSIGWAAFPWYPGEPDEVTCETVLGLADRGVFEAKLGGRNRAVGISPSAPERPAFTATAGDHLPGFSVQELRVPGPAQELIS